MFVENPKLLFCKKHLSKMVTLFLIFCVLLFWGEKKYKAKQTILQENQKVAEKLLFSQEETLTHAELEQVELLVKKKAEFKERYQAALTLAYLAQNQNEKALNQISFQTPKKEEMEKFHEISLLCLKNQDLEAFEKSMEFEKCSSLAPHSSLRLHHLLRLFFLAKKHNDSLCQSVTFEKIQSHPLWKDGAQLFVKDQLSLKDFL